MSLLAFAGPEGKEAAQRAAFLHFALIGHHSDEKSTLETIFGSGLSTLKDDSKFLVPTLLVSTEYSDLSAQSELYNLAESTTVLEIVRSAVGNEISWLDEVYVAVSSPPNRHSAPADPIYGGGRGTAGCNVTWSGGNGFLTAGHVATDSSPVYSAGLRGPIRSQQLGNVIYSHDPAGKLSTPCADIALVKTVPTNRFQGKFSGQSSAAPHDRVAIHSRKGSISRIKGYFTYIYWSTCGGLYGDCYMTTTKASTSGDSGSAVTKLNKNEVLGMVVGASSHATYIQDIAFQISAIPQTSKHLSGISI